MDTLLFKLNPDEIQFHYANNRDRLFQTPMGTKDELGWISTGISFHYNTPEDNFIDWLCEFLTWLFKSSNGTLSETKFLEAIAFAKALSNNSKYAEVKNEVYSRFDGNNLNEDFMKVFMERQ